jgi:non-canonical poly(A) RNA polymerase PAPD5/7
MGDSWRGDAYRPRGYNDNSYGYDRYDRGQPPPPPDRYARDPPPRQSRDMDGYQFRGAAQPDSYRDNRDSYRPQDQRPPDFSFRAAGPPAPHFPPAAPGQYNQPAGQRRDHRGNDRGGRGGGRGRGRFRSRAAHARDLMSKSTRAATPEQMEGMNGEGKAHYVDYISSEEDDEAASTGGDNDEQPSKKRTKTAAVATESLAAPKWSNPDPYTVLPPTDVSMAPKKDIVQTIRKAKVEAANKASSANAIKENVDFISFDDFNDEAMDEDPAEGSEDGEIEDNGGVDLGFNIVPRFDREPSVGGVPPPPPDVPMPEKQELTMLSNNSLREARRTALRSAEAVSNKRKRGPEPPSSTAGVIVSEWVSDGSNPTPWFSDDGTFSSHVGLQ